MFFSSFFHLFSSGPTVFAAGTAPAGAAAGFALSGDRLLRFNLANPGEPAVPLTVTGVAPGETLLDLDVRPVNGALYALARTADGRVRLYTLSRRTGAATPLSSSPQGLTAPDGVTPLPVTGSVAIDFNPAVDRLRIVTGGGLNFRMNPNTGQLIDGDPNAPGVQPDAALNGGAMRGDGTLYTNNQALAATTTQYTLDAGARRLFIQHPPNAGTLTGGLPLTENGAPLNFTEVAGFDAPDGPAAPTSGAAAAGTAFAVLRVGGLYRLYAVELATGAARLVGPVGNGTDPVRGLAVEPQPVAGDFTVALNQNGSRLVLATLGRFSAVEVPVSGVGFGERLVGLDFRPATGQLYALGVNSELNTGTLYLVDPRSGVCTALTPGGVGFVAADGATRIVLPPGGYGLDFNPVVDLLRVVTETGLNFRVNPVDGRAIDGDPNAFGVQPDARLNGVPGRAGVGATAYTNAFAGATATTQYTIDGAGRGLYIQHPPNSGTQRFVAALTLDGVPAPPLTVYGFDIPAETRVTVSGEPVRGGRGVLFVGIGGAGEILSLDLATGRCVRLARFSSSAVTGFSAGALAARVVVEVDKLGVFRSPGVAFIRNTATSGFADAAFGYGRPGDLPVVGDWDGDGVDTFGVFRPASGQFFLRNSNTPGFADAAFAYGQPGDIPVAGDWTGKGFDSVGVFRNGVFLLRNVNAAGFADRVATLGRAGDSPVVGDWNGDGRTGVGVFQGGVFLLRDGDETAAPPQTVTFGQPGDIPVAGDWTGKGFDSVGVFRNGVFLLRNANVDGAADFAVAFGSPGDAPVVGNWNGETR